MSDPCEASYSKKDLQKNIEIMKDIPSFICLVDPERSRCMIGMTTML